VGSEHIERFIPVADAQNERSLMPQPPNEASRTSSDTTVNAAVTATATREMPKFAPPKRTPPPAGTAQVARTERKVPTPAKPVAKPAGKQTAKAGTAAKAAAPPRPADRGGPSDAARAQVVADAERLVQWGRKWYELPELIARMAGRPSLPEVRRILKENKAAIDSKGGGSAG
jgi:hypothetical protein